MFSLRIVNVDHYMSSPKSGLDLTYSQFRAAQIKSVPVLRIFGSTPSGNKTCLHIHGVFPYILVPCSGKDDAGRFMYQLASSLDKAINVSQSTSHSTRQHVFKIVQVSGRPFYGYHSQDHQFFKIYFYNPAIVKRACDLLQNGVVCGTKFQIHEGHVPFTLQFFIDYNLYGMSFINLKSIVYRSDASPPGVTPGSLPKESCCELEADAVAVDILNRLTIEGELAVNPGLAAIWQEEKKRLKRDALEVSQRPEPLLAMSEILLKEKLGDNLKFKGKCKTPLKEDIPYPAETQRTSGSDILDASMLDTHSVSSLASTRANAAEETTVVDEDLVLSLTQSSILASSLDQSLLMALDDLAAQNEVNAVMSQNVEDDSILGSQMVSGQDLFETDISDEELETLNFSLPLDLPSDNYSENENDEESDEHFDEHIPQLDGVDDMVGKKKKSKQSKRKRRVLVENSATEIYSMSDGEEILLNNLKDNNCWPASGKQETLEEIFSDEEPYYSPINNYDDSCESVDLEPINIDPLSSFETVLRGDPSFTSEDLASEDVIFQPMDENVDDSGERKSSLNEEQSFKETQNISDKKPLVDKNCNTDAMVSFNSSLDMDKSVMLAINGDELLSTSQLDEILNDDLNKGLEIICEESPSQEFEENWVRSGDISKPAQIKEEHKDCLNNDILATDDEFVCKSEEIIEDLNRTVEENFQSEDLLSEFNIEFEALEVKPFISDSDLNEIQPTCDITSSLDMVREKKTNNSPKKNVNKKFGSWQSPQKNERKKLYVKLFKKKKALRFKHYQPFEMSRKEIEKYYSQLGAIVQYLSERMSDEEQPPPILWTPIRENVNVENAENKRKRKKTIKRKLNTENMSKKCKLSKKEILKMKSCKVKVYKLTEYEIKVLSGSLVCHFSDFNENKLNIVKNRFEQNSSENTPLKLENISESKVSSIVTNLKSKISIKEKKIKQKKSLPKDNSAKKKPCSKKFLIELSNKMPTLQLQEKSPKPESNVKKKSHPPKNSLLKSSNNVPESQLLKLESVVIPDISLDSHDDQNFTCKDSKLKKVSRKVNQLQEIKNNSVVKEVLLNEEGKATKTETEKNVSSTEKTKEISKTESINKFCKQDSSVQDQSSSFKLHKRCVLRLTPLTVDPVSEINNKDSLVIKGDPRKGCCNNRRSHSETPQEHNLDEVKLNEEYNLNPFVRVEKLVTAFNSSDDVQLFENKVKSGFKSKKSSLNEAELKSVKSESLKESLCRKRPLRIYSLDGTVDNSSSDENLDEKESVNKPQVTSDHCSTPNKRKKMKSCSSPRSYAPLNIEVKKSPKQKPKNEVKEPVRPVVAESLIIDHTNKGVEEDVMALTDVRIEDKLDSLKCDVKRKHMEPLVKRIPSLINLNSSTSKSDHRNQPRSSTSSGPILKRLKVSVKRLSLETQGDALNHERVVEIRARSHRSSSLPITSQ